MSQRSDFDKGRSATVALLARLVRATEWDPATRKRLNALIALCRTIRIDSHPEKQPSPSERKG